MLYIMEESGRRIAKLRIQKGYTQERLADALNIDRSYLSKIEAGKRSCSIDLLVQLSAFFGVSLDYLVLGKKGFIENVELTNMLDDIITQLAEFREKL